MIYSAVGSHQVTDGVQNICVHGGGQHSEHPQQAEAECESSTGCFLYISLIAVCHSFNK